MKTLYLVRHAKAVSRDLDVPDFERSLEKVGRKDAKNMAQRLKEEGMVPDLFISSPANRALETAHLFAKQLGYPVQKILLKDAIYDDPTADKLLEIVREVDEKHSSVVLFGHNPSFNEFASYLLRDFEKDIPTCGVVAIDFAKNIWKKISRGGGVLKFFGSPGDDLKKSGAYKKIRKDLEAKILQQLEDTLKEPDIRAEKKITRSVKNLAKKVVKVLKAREVGGVEGADTPRREASPTEVTGNPSGSETTEPTEPNPAKPRSRRIKKAQKPRNEG